MHHAEDALRTCDFEVDLIGGPELRACVVEAESEGLIPDEGVARGVGFWGKGVGEVGGVGEGVDVVWVGG